MTIRASELQRQYPDMEANHTADVDSLLRAVADRVRAVFLLLFVAAVVLLLIARRNVASLLLARSVARTQETAVRMARAPQRCNWRHNTFAEGMLWLRSAPTQVSLAASL